MRFGLALPHYDFSQPGLRPVTFEAVADWAVRAEGLGFDSVWISDHFFLSLQRYGGSDEPFGSIEPMTALAGLAVRTTRVRLGTLVLGAPFRQPAVLAKSATAIDLLSGGRVDLGLGAGWYEDEFARFAIPFETAGARFGVLEDTLRALGALLAGPGPVSLEGRRVHLRGATNVPPPAQSPRIPLWVGSKGGPRSMALAARLADGWNTVWRWSPDAYAATWEGAARICEAEDRDPATMRRSVGLYTIVGEDEEDVAARFDRLRAWGPGLESASLEALEMDTLTGTPERALERVGEFAALGVEELILSPAQIPFAIPDPEMVELVAERVVAPGRAL
jgi:alkanesulfonate monooxygenase SsuD/methylene tetrahydromethanopterin reductase-like flavin-dependent oxidoreductase (luciferase family)